VDEQEHNAHHKPDDWKRIKNALEESFQLSVLVVNPGCIHSPIALHPGCIPPRSHSTKLHCTVILSGVADSRSEAATQSKDPALLCAIKKAEGSSL
jgi:hypothetical protein